MTTLTDVLYIEDDPDIQDIVKLTLEHFGGITVHVCESYKAALEKLKSVTPQMIFLDVMMPDVDGIKTLQSLRRMPVLAQVPVVFITAKTQKQEIDHYMSLQAVGVIKKPFDPNTLVETVTSLWNKYTETILE